MPLITATSKRSPTQVVFTAETRSEKEPFVKPVIAAATVVKSPLSIARIARVVVIVFATIVATPTVCTATAAPSDSGISSISLTRYAATAVTRNPLFGIAQHAMKTGSGRMKHRKCHPSLMMELCN
jgi:hypothetical protein